MVITDFNKKPLNMEIKTYLKGNHYQQADFFFTDYWDVESGFVSTPEEKAIIEQLSKGIGDVQNEEENPKE